MQRVGHRAVRAIAAAFLAGACAAAIAAQTGAPGAPGECVAQPPAATTPDYLRSIAALDDALGVPRDYANANVLPPEPVASVLVDAGRDVRGRTVRLAPAASAAWRAMVAAAARDEVVLRLVSGYRSPDYQARLLRAKLHGGMDIESALRVNAAPGYSEHQTGCAVDLTTPGIAPAQAAFAGKRAYRWLRLHAGEYGFHLSYPAGNIHDIEFEPWHWRYIASVPPAAPETTPPLPPAATSALPPPSNAANGEDGH